MDRTELDVAAIRLRCAKLPDYLTQSKFAAATGIPVATLRHWEQRKRRPSGAALVLLRLLREDPSLIRRMQTILPNPSMEKSQ